MTIIRENLDRKKVIADNHLENATPEEIEEAYNNYLAEKEAERQAEIALAEKEKARIEEKQKEENLAKEAYLAELETIRAKIIANGGSPKEAEKAIKEKESARKLELKTKRKESLAKIVAEQKSLSVRKKVFVAEWKVKAIAEHKELVAIAKKDIENAKSDFAQNLSDYKKLLSDKELVAKYKTDAIQLKFDCNAKIKNYKSEKANKLVAETARFATDKAKIAKLKDELVTIKVEHKVKLDEYKNNYNNTIKPELDSLNSKLKDTTDITAKEVLIKQIKDTKKATKVAKRDINKEYSTKKSELIKNIDRLSFAHSSAISQISVDYNKQMDIIKKEKRNANKLKAMKKEIVQNKKTAIAEAKHKSQSIKLWLNVLASEAFAKLIAEEALNSVATE